MLIADLWPVDADIDIQHGYRVQLLSIRCQDVRRVLQDPVGEWNRQRGNQIVIPFLAAAFQPDIFLLWIDVFHSFVRVHPLDRFCQGLGKTIDAATLRVNESRVVTHALVRQAQCAVDNLFQ